MICDACTTPLSRHELSLRLALALWLGLGLAGRRADDCSKARTSQYLFFRVLAASSSHWWHDQPLYVEYKPLDYFRYPPVFAVLITPFHLLGLTVGGIAWTWLGMIVYAIGLWRFLRDVAPGKWTTTGIVAFFALAALACLVCWNAPVANALATGLLLLSVSAWIRRRWWACAWWLAASVALKLTPLAPASSSSVRFDRIDLRLASRWA